MFSYLRRVHSTRTTLCKVQRFVSGAVLVQLRFTSTRLYILSWPHGISHESVVLPPLRYACGVLASRFRTREFSIRLLSCRALLRTHVLFRIRRSEPKHGVFQKWTSYWRSLWSWSSAAWCSSPGWCRWPPVPTRWSRSCLDRGEIVVQPSQALLTFAGETLPTFLRDNGSLLRKWLQFPTDEFLYCN